MRRGSVRMNTDDEQSIGLLKIHSTEATSLLNEDEYVSNSAKDDVDVQITTKRSANIRNEEGIVVPSTSVTHPTARQLQLNGFVFQSKHQTSKDGAEVYQCHSRDVIQA
ncbi:ribosomal protein mS8 [Acrasis kona]|uniref:Ribosomal protein mS8 n=1 Tax=Acrasis kona TaxID=1008807 RepID=A0AAW2ZHV2_9EUKA